MTSEYNKLLELTRARISVLEESKEEGSVAELEKLKKIYQLLSNQYEFLFEKISMDLALAILSDIGLSKEDSIAMYQSIIKENIKKKYTLLNIDLNEEER